MLFAEEGPDGQGDSGISETFGGSNYLGGVFNGWYAHCRVLPDCFAASASHL
jgi:hypothetical protein